MISYGRQYIDKKDITNVIKVLRSSFLTQGPIVQIFEKKLSKKLNSKKVSCVSSGSAALHIVAKTFGWKKGDRIVSSPITFVAGITSALHCGAYPEFIDIDKDTFNIDPNKLEDKLKKQNKIKAAIITDFAGQPSDWEDLLYLKKKYKIKLVNDNCHSLGSLYKNDIGYAVKYADVSCLSFHPVKHITTGEGGAILTNDKKLYSKFNLYKSHGILRSKNIVKPWLYEMKELGFNYRLSDINAALGISQLEKVDKFLKFRQKTAKKYSSILSEIEEIKLPFLKPQRTHTYHLYVLRINFKSLNKSKLDLFKFFLKHGIKLQVHYIPIFLQPYFRKNYKVNFKNFPNALNYYEEAFSIPIFYGLKDQTIIKVKKLLKIFLK
jgi:dTDP-4-amino-4,6-dideoxygalactose transaminase